MEIFAPPPTERFVAWMDDNWNPVAREVATLCKVIEPDGTMRILRRAPPVEKYDPTQPRDAHGRWSGGSGVLSEALATLRDGDGFTYDLRTGAIPKEGYS